MGFLLFPDAPDINIPDPEIPDPPEETVRRVRRPAGLEAAQLSAQTQGTKSLNAPTTGLNIPEF